VNDVTRPPFSLLASAVTLLFALTATAASAESFTPPAGFGADDLEALTSVELRERIAHGATTVIVPIGGTEQSGAHIVLGKHNVRAHVLADRIAQALGNAIVAPVVAYVPEGAIHPPTQHMKYAGTISVPDAVFEALLEATARSLKQHGFRDVVFLGDHGGYQSDLTQVKDKLNREWAADPACRAHAPLEYYRIAQTGYVQALKAHGVSDAELGSHAGLADTALALAVDPALVRANKLAGPYPPGITGNPRRATAELGELGTKLIVDTTVAAIRRETQAPR
jgi:creatinine amidohydrolase/Fe(II)-dependent formamide hydrolase-like protein